MPQSQCDKLRFATLAPTERAKRKTEGTNEMLSGTDIGLRSGARKTALPWQWYQLINGISWTVYE